MPRARLLKPEAYASKQVTDAGELAFGLLQTLWIWGDDVGIHPAQPHVVARNGIGTWGHGADEIMRRIDRLKKAVDETRQGEPLVYEYGVDGVRYWLVPGFIRQNAKQHKPSSRFPLPRVTADSPAWLNRWMREYEGFLQNFPPDIRRKFPDVRESYPDLDSEADPDPDPDPDLDTDLKPITPAAVVATARATPSDDPPDRAGRGQSPAGSGPKGKAGEQALALLTANLNASDAKIRDMLGDDQALELAVRHCGGWPKLRELLHTGGTKAQNRFLVAFGRSCSELRGARPKAHHGQQEHQRAP